MHKTWSWQHEKWPEFIYDDKKIIELEREFTKNSGIILGVLKHVKENEEEDFLVDILCNEAIKTSEIEGEYLDRESVQSSIKQNLGLSTDRRKVSPAEYGISEMMVDLLRNFQQPLTHQQLFTWNEMITNGRRDLTEIGKYRTHLEPMQVVSNRLDTQIVYFEAPPSNIMENEMEQFVQWFNQQHSKQNKGDSPITKAGIAHFYFVIIHPFEDGNGRIARALAEKSLALSTGKPSYVSLSQTIEQKKKDYYAALEKNNTKIDITNWLIYFGNTIINAQINTLNHLDFIIQKTKFFDKYSSQLNERQLKVIQRIFKEGHQGLIGGLSAKNYSSIAKTSASTATRDLKELLEKGIFLKTGSLKSTRYSLKLQEKHN